MPEDKIETKMEDSEFKTKLAKKKKIKKITNKNKV